MISGWQKKIRGNVTRTQRLPGVMVWVVGVGSGAGVHIKNIDMFRET